MLLVAALALTLLLGSCASRATAKATLTLTDTITAVEGGGMSADQLKNVGKMLVTVYDDAEFDVRDWLIAATRGHDMLAEGFNDANATGLGTADPVATAKNILDKANAKASDSNKISAENYANLNALDLQRLVDNFKTTVDVEAKGGLWDKLLSAVGAGLNWITKYLGFGNYLLGICIFAVVVEILMLPFAVKQQKNSIRQAHLRPKEMAIRNSNKYKGRNDQVTQQKMQREIQELYQRENFSPLAGCLPLLLQFPILIALYNIVIDPLHYVLGQATSITGAISSYYTAARAAGGMGMTMSGSTASSISFLAEAKSLEAFRGISDFAYFNNGSAVWDSLSKIGEIPNFTVLGKNFGVAPSLASVDVLLLIPILTFVVYFFSMRLSRKFNPQPGQDAATDRQVACSNSMMDVSMPLMSTFFAFMVPGLIGVYWIFRSLLTTLKQFIMSRVMPLPTFTEADYKAAAKEMAGKAPKVEKSANAGKVRSLHHIDDEDFDDTREKAMERRALLEEKEREENAKKAKSSPFGATELKDDPTEDQKNDDN